MRLADPSVSRVHARIRPDRGDGALLSDAGSTYGTWLDGRRVRGTAPLREGALIRVGDQELSVDRARGDDEAGDTVVVPPVLTTAAAAGVRALRSGYALKRLAAAEGERRWVLKDLRSGEFVRLSVADAELLVAARRDAFARASSSREAAAPAGRRRARPAGAAAGRRSGSAGCSRAVRGVTVLRRAGWRRVLAPRTLAWAGAGALFARLYAAGGRRC